MSALKNILMLWLALGLQAAWAHKPSDAYLSMQVKDHGVIEQRLDIALRDLDRDLALDADGDGQLTWREVRERWTDVTQLAAAAVVVRRDGQRCVPEAVLPAQLDEHGDGRYVVLISRLRCADTALRATRLEVAYGLFAQTDPTHRGIARVQVPGRDEPLTMVLVPGEPGKSLSLAPSEGGSRWGQTRSFFLDGLHHIAMGLDHLLFLVTLLMVAVWRREGSTWVPREAARSVWREALKLVSAFTLAHSLTLALAAAGVLAPPARWVESLIAMSVLVAAVDNLKPFLPGPRWVTVAVFGLVHGFGFAGPLQDLGLRGGDLAWPLLGFNLGVEAGQLMVVALLLPLALKARASAGYRRWVVRPGSAMVAVLALVWTLERAVGGAV